MVLKTDGLNQHQSSSQR